MNIYDDTPETGPKIFTKLPSRQTTIGAMRSSMTYQNARNQYLQRAQAIRNNDGTKGQPCWLCGEPIDYRLKFPHPRSWSLDHAIPVKDNPALFLNTANFRSAHLDCNNHRQTDSPPIDLGEPSEIW